MKINDERSPPAARASGDHGDTARGRPGDDLDHAEQVGRAGLAEGRVEPRQPRRRGDQVLEQRGDLDGGELETSDQQQDRHDAVESDAAARPLQDH